MRKKRFNEEQIIVILKEAEGSAEKIRGICRKRFWRSRRSYSNKLREEVEEKPVYSERSMNFRIINYVR